MTTEPFEPAAPEPGPIPEPASAPPVAPPAASPPPAQGAVGYAAPAYMAPAGGRPGARSSRTIIPAVLAVALAILIGGLGFAAGRLTAPSPERFGNGFRVPAGLGFQNNNNPQTAPRNRGQSPGNVGPFQGGQFQGTQGLAPRPQGTSALRGTVVSTSDTALTLKLANGQTVDIAVDSGTGYHRQADATAADVTTGSTVIVSLGGIASSGQGTGPTASSITIVP